MKGLSRSASLAAAFSSVVVFWLIRPISVSVRFEGDFTSPPDNADSTGQTTISRASCGSGPGAE
jgi:hypothetical protein